MATRVFLVVLALASAAVGSRLAARQELMGIDSIDAAAALAVLDSAKTHGLDPADYDARGLRSERERLLKAGTSGVAGNGASDEAIRAFQRRLLSALLALGRDVAIGRTPPSAVDTRWRTRRTPPDIAESLDAAISHGTLGEWLSSIEPPHPEYAALRRWLENPARTAPDRMSLRDTEARVAINMEWWRRMPDTFGTRHVFVNIPSATLVVRDGGADVLEMKVVVGAPNNRTPVLSSAIDAVVFSPYWNIPESIVTKEILPAVRRNPDYLERQNIEVMPGRGGGRDLYRQRPGPSNALGLVKFIFANDYGVYMHDTPVDSAFARAERALSHGCVRLEEPKALAEWILSAQDDGAGEWTPAAIDEAMNAGTERWVRLSSPIPVHTAYFTVTVGPDGALHFWRDVYRMERGRT
jgi:murein L,D-transpeptidase YcbB/YkuD